MLKFINQNFLTNPKRVKYKNFSILFFLIVLIFSKNINAQIHSSNAYCNVISTKSQLKHLEFLCSDKAAGRGSGTEGGRITADYIKSEFEKYGLQPYFNGKFFQDFFLKASNSHSGFSSQAHNKGRNIVGLIPAKKKFANSIIICAHYDHIGKIKGKIYPGADDNASGVTALLELAKAFGLNFKENGGNEYNLIFVAFDGNNYNLSGSKYFLENFFGGNKISCVINIDQIGSTLSPPNNRKDYLLVLGTEHLTPWQKRQIDYVNKFFKINLDIDYSYYNSKEFYDIFYRLSDHYPFFLKNIPSILFSSGITKHTNKESDNIQNLDIAILNKRINLIYRFLWQIN